MGEVMDNVDISVLERGAIFDGDELVVSKFRSGMITLRKEVDSDEIRYFMYDWNPDVDKCSIHNNGYGEMHPGDLEYDLYKRELASRGLWK